MNDNTQAEAVSALAPLTRQVTLAGKEYTVRRLETRQVWPILRGILPIIDGLAALVPKDSSVAGGPSLGAGPGAASQAAGVQLQGLAGLFGGEIATFMKTMADHGERVTEMIACALDCKVSEVGKAEIQETYFAARAIVEVNRDFFTQRVLPLLGDSTLGESALAVGIRQSLVNIGAGETPSSN